MTLRVVFMGSPEFAVPTLKDVSASFQVTGVVTQPDKPRGRGRKPIPTAVKAAAVELGLAVVEPEKIGSDEFLATLRAWRPDVIVVAAYGKILPERVLNLPPMGCINLHGSLLPRYRGASPVAAAILAGDRTTGACTILMDRGMDTGDILLSEEIPIRDDDTSGTLHDRLSKHGARLVVRTLQLHSEGKIRPVPQDDSSATCTQLLSKKDAQLDWNREAVYLSRLVRAMNPRPCAFLHWSGKAIKVWETVPRNGSGDPGRIVAIGSDGIAVGTAEGLLVLTQVQAPGRKSIKAVEFARGVGLQVGDML